MTAITMEDLARQLGALQQRMALVEAEAGARRTLARYMALCDVPSLLPALGQAERCDAIAELFTPEAIWEGVGGAHGAQFGRQTGRAQIAAHFLRFYSREMRGHSTPITCAANGCRPRPKMWKAAGCSFSLGSMPRAHRF